MKKTIAVIAAIAFILAFTTCTPKRISFSNGRFVINGQEVFMSGMNLAWIHFGRDITEFNEAKFVQALEEIAAKGGNCLRWWIHVNGSTSPLYDENKRVVTLPPGFTETLNHALDLAWERGIMVVLSLWSFDMLKRNTGVDLVANLKMLEDPVYTKGYVNQALIPMIRKLKGHPAILCYEIFNEPEGMLPSGGWTDKRTSMQNLQRFINLCAGAIHRTDPDALVTVGSGLAMTANVKGFSNYYANDKLIKAGGDQLGYLDFYEAHYYPEHEGESTSPFHNPASYWKLDKPILIGEFPAKGIREIGKGFQPKTSLTSEEAYLYAFEHGYAGALAWTWTNHDGFGGVEEAGPGMQALLKKYPQHIVIKTGLNRPPLVIKKIERLILDPAQGGAERFANLKDYFLDMEDGPRLKFLVGKISQPELLSASVDEEGYASIKLKPGQSGTCKVEIIAEDTGGAKRSLELLVFVYDPNKGNLALFKKAISQSDEGDTTAITFINDGLDDTRWSSAWADDQWMYIDLGAIYPVKKFILKWETAFGLAYEILVSTDNKTWQTVFVEKNGDGKTDEITINPIKARYVKLHGTKRATEWGFSLWEFEVYGED